ncbi:MAG: hypothetical protein ABMA64_26085 [Myxococcota bacterium]
MDEWVAHGAPVPVEVAMARALRTGLALIVGPITLALWWFDLWWWLPIPAAWAVVTHEWILGPRRDPASRLTLAGPHLSLADSVRAQELTVDLGTITVATVTEHRVREGTESVLMLADAGGPVLALRFLAATTDAVGLHQIDAWVGGTGGPLPAVHAVAPLDGIGRQRFERPDVLAAIVSRVDPPARARVGARTYAGVAPPLDPYGFQLGEPGGWLVVDGERWTWTVGGSVHEGALEGSTLVTRTRPAALFARDREPVEVQIPLLGLVLPGGPTLYFPASVDASRFPAADPRPDDQHTHFPEGASVLWAARARVPALDAALRSAGGHEPAAQIPSPAEPSAGFR